MLRDLTPPVHPDLLVGTATGDDAAVWRLDAERALVVTVDFITPIVDDARTWGRIAAVNAASDVYAMGGRPLLALNLVCWNDDELTIDVLSEVLAGAGEVAAEAGFVVAGGHTVSDPEPKFGMAVVGEVHPDRLLTNAGLRPGQQLVLTKPLGTGVIATAIKQGAAPPTSVEAAVAAMTKLSADAARVALAAGATGATDITGYGLLGHLGRMAQESSVDATIDVASVPMLPGARELAAAGYVAGGSRRNLRWVQDRLDAGAIDEVTVALLADAQTAGGLVFGVDAGEVDGVLEALADSGHDGARIGAVESRPGRGLLRLVPGPG